MIICDAASLIAILNSQDSSHGVCDNLLSGHSGRLIVPSPIVTEVCYMTATRLGAKSEAAFLQSLAQGELELFELDASDLFRMAELVLQYADFPLGAADASVIAVAERLGATDIATLDLRHFSAVRPKHTNHFTLLP